MLEALAIDPTGTSPPTDEELRSVVGGGLPPDSRLTPLKRFKLDLSANPGFRKLFFAARCDCGTSALLSVEVAGHKTLAEVEEATPQLIDRLESQAGAFYGMSCEAHKNMQLGPAVRPNATASGPK